jgi:hypothetical protein
MSDQSSEFTMLSLFKSARRVVCADTLIALSMGLSVMEVKERLRIPSDTVTGFETSNAVWRAPVCAKISKEERKGEPSAVTLNTLPSVEVWNCSENLRVSV